jgi:alpha-mannosidase
VRSLLLVLALLIASAQAVSADSKVYTVATSHLDTQWRWDIRTTIDEYILNTLDDNFALLEKYPDYVFSFEGAFRYQLMKEYYPERFARLKHYVAQGRWQVCGSWLDAVDVNMPSPESLFRNALYGNGWFRRELGVSSVDVFLPDCFGFGYALPSVMAHSGLKGFTTQKLTWGSAYGTPFDVGRWRGVDGSEVLAAVNPGSYSADLPGDVSRDTMAMEAIDRLTASGGPAVAYRFYGTGDVGGSPSESSVQLMEESLQSDGPLQVVSAGADQIYRELTDEQIAALPLYDGELVMTRHGAGCYTSQAAMKRWYRKCEVMADAAERAATLAWHLGGSEYPRQELERAWTRFLWHGFHDDLTGTSIPSAYTYSWNDLLLSQKEFAQVLDSSLSAVVKGMDTGFEGLPVVVFNPLAFPRTETVRYRVPRMVTRGQAFQVFAPDGTEVPVQYDSEDFTILFTATVPAAGVAIYEVRTPGHLRENQKNPAWDKATNTLDTPRYRLRFGPEGLQSMVEKQSGRELLSAPPRLQLLKDDPERWSAWEIDYDDIMAAPYAEVPLGGIPETVLTGPLVSRLTFTHEAEGSVFRQTLTVSGDRVDWDLDIDWAGKATLLKAAFFTTARDTAVTYDLGLGAIRRGLNRPKLYEVPAQRWADLTDSSGQFGLSVMNDSRYGWDHPDQGTLRLSLIHTPGISRNWTWLDDQKSQDLGRHQVKIGMLGHGADWRRETVRQADCLNQPLMVMQTFDNHPGPLGRSVSLLQAEGAEARAVKKSEAGDWVVVRLQETSGQAAENVTIKAIAPILEVRELLADEVPIEAGSDLVMKDGKLSCSLRPYQPRTLALRLKENHDLGLSRSEPVALPYNLDGISPCNDPTDGDWDGLGNSLPSEAIPLEFTRDGVRFVTGPRRAGQANLLRCQGQTIELPDSDLDRLQLLVCAVKGPGKLPLGYGEVAIPAGVQWFGQWDSRLTGEDAVHEADQIAPGFLTGSDLGWIITHGHQADGSTLSYAFTHFYRVETRRPKKLVLPDDPNLVILAASLTDAGPRVRGGARMMDWPNRPSVTIQPAGGTFVDSLTVTMASPNPDVEIRVARADGKMEKWRGEPLLITDSTELAVTARGDFAEETVRHASFTRVEPWPATAQAGTRSGLATRTYLGAWSLLPDWTNITPSSETISPTVAIPAGLPEEDIGAVLAGVIDIPARGAYRFWLSSDDGSRLWIDGKLAADHDGLHGSSPLRCDVPLAAGPHTILVEFFQHLGGADLKLEWSGPGIERQEVPATALSH